MSVVLAVAACASPEIVGRGEPVARPNPANEDRLQQQARDALARWDAALAAAGGRVPGPSYRWVS